MQFSVIAAIATFAAGAIAVPHEEVRSYPHSVPGDVTVGQAGDACGKDLELSCCNEVDQSGDSVTAAEGLLSGLLQNTLAGGDIGLFKGCSKLNVAAVIGITDLLNSQCKQNVACCQDSDTTQEGLVNVGLPCVALGSVL